MTAADRSADHDKDDAQRAGSVTASTVTQPFLWDAPRADRRRRQPRPLPAACALCAAPSATPFGLCRDCLGAAAAEHARLTVRLADPDDPRPSAVSFRSLCQRCGRAGHDVRGCDT